jgi:hypothetical protein
MKCESRITKEYETRKAVSYWPRVCPSGVWIDNPNAVGEVCGGDVTIILKAVDEPDWGGHYATLEIERTCTRCRWPWVPIMEKLPTFSTGEINLNELLDL